MESKTAKLLTVRRLRIMLQLYQMYKLPEPNFKFDQFEPFIDAKTMEIHYTKHHQGYVDKLNVIIENNPTLKDKTLEELAKIPETKNMAGGHLNHTFFWQMLIGGVKDLDFSKYKDDFTQSALSLFGSGWVWLVENGDLFEVITTPNQDSPLVQDKKPVLGLDLWEHSYYLKYQSRRAEYVDVFWKFIENR